MRIMPSDLSLGKNELKSKEETGEASLTSIVVPCNTLNNTSAFLHRSSGEKLCSMRAYKRLTSSSTLANKPLRLISAANNSRESTSLMLRLRSMW